MVSEWPWIPAFDSAEDIEEDLIPEGWQVKQIEDLYHQLPIGKRFDKKSASSSGTVPVIDQSANGVIGWHDESPGIMASQESPVVTFANHTCEMRLMRRPFSVIQNVFPLVGKEGVCDTRFLYYGTKGRVHLEEYKGHYPDFRRKWILVPPLPDQRAIAHILGTLDDKIELNRRMNQTLEAIAQAIFKSWFVDFDPVIDNALTAGKPIPEEFAERAARRAQLTHGGSYLPESIRRLFPDEFQDSELGLIPKGWRVGIFGELSYKPQYGYTASAQTEPIGPKFLRITDINKRSWITWESVPYCEISDVDYEKYRLRKGDILIARMADPGHGVMIEEDREAVFASYLIQFRPFDERYDRYLQYWLRSDRYWNLVRARGAGTTRVSLNARVISAFQLLVPPPLIAEAFHDKVGMLREHVVANVAESSVRFG